ncbi:MAG: hypothetical protein U7126_11820 [Microcoleus sp.]
MKFDITKFESKFETIVQQFLGGEMSAEQFSSDFTTLWMSFRDEQYKIKDTWDKRYDLELLEHLQKGELTSEEFTQKSRELMGTTEIFEFINMVDAIHSACHVFNPFPGPIFEGEITEEQLRAEVQALITNYQSKK